MQMPVLETKRLVVRPLTLDDLDFCHDLYLDIGWADAQASDQENRETRRQWLDWTVRNYEQLARLHQPPYGERGVILRQADQLIGLVGYVPCLDPFGQLPYFGGTTTALHSAEMGLFWAFSPAHQRQGYASEAAQALVDFAFATLRLKRIVALTDYHNVASQGVMRRLGMYIEKNPFEAPPWFQVVGILENGHSKE